MITEGENKVNESLIVEGKGTQKLSWPTRLGFAMGTVGDAVPYYLFYTYFLFYLTNIVGINPAIAGIISSIAIVWNAVASPVVGYMSDSSKNPKGRRRPFMKKGTVGEGVILILLFLPTPFTGALQIIYYFLMAILLWTSYTCVVIPLQSMGGELTDDYNERNMLTLCISLLSLPFGALCNSGPMWIQAFLLPRGYTESQCWLITAICGVVCILGGMAICLKATKGKESITKKNEAPTEADSVRGFISIYAKLLRLKPYRILVLVGLFFLSGYTLCQAILVYSMTYNANMSEAQQGTFWLIFSIVAVAGAPVCTFLANKTSKKTGFMIFSLITGAVCLTFYFTGIKSPTMGFCFGILFGFFCAGFWCLFYSMIYDSIELYEFKYGTRHEGSVVSLAAFIQTSGGAIASLIAGFSLELVGYSGDGIITESISHGILTLTTLVPAILIAISMVLLSMYKLNRKEFDAIKEALECKKAGKEYSTEAFDNVL